ncbi:uncharacterized protein LOC120275920 [Dioscorea cayenensis subsp. rotundata]|uniref:Uncharacterized protein LOC120275920 n=1 Tax=Dioscorea cayennensis subsp. rotundata TaxID=55577 RepID=A0AB40CIK2_DIOCR|nr:uncharacterized protein LOC120275920 [Dioscorea cayenensis subsp. rotundata]
MAEDLDDGELWLPSDIVPDLGLRRHPKPTIIPDPLHDRLAALALLDPTRYKTPSAHPNPLLGSREPSLRTRFNPAEIPSRSSFIYNGIVFSPSPRPVYQFNQVDSFGARRARVTQRQPERFFPARFNGPGRERTAGTGVFLPRVVNNEFRKKSSMKSGEQQQQKQQPIRNAVGGRQGMSFQPPASEMCLPQDWTY